jgi:hypothetical protein
MAKGYLKSIQDSSLIENFNAHLFKESWRLYNYESLKHTQGEYGGGASV